MSSVVAIAGYLALFSSVGLIFVFVNLLVGRFLRPSNPHPEKGEIYECGEPAIGSSFVQFDLRFYVVALLFIIFDVEVAFFFPWATVFGKATQLMDKDLVVATAEDPFLHARGLYRELGVEDSGLPVGPQDAASFTEAAAAMRESATNLAWFSMGDIAVFFAVLLVGFAYVWKRGDLDWVRAVSHSKGRAVVANDPSADPEPVLSA